MYSEADLNSAVEAGALSPEAADALRGHVATLRASPAVDEENFRLVNSFNDIFVSIAAIILLVAMWAIGNALMGDRADYTSMLPLPPKSGDLEVYYINQRYQGLGWLFSAATAWLLAEYFTRKRHMAFPSIILLVAFVMGLAFGLTYFYFDWEYSRYGQVWEWSSFSAHNVLYTAQQHRELLAYAVIGLITMAGAWLHWRRFHVPISVAASTLALAAFLLFLVFWSTGLTLSDTGALVLTLLAGLATFAFAMRWDLSDPTRKSYRSDVAFWLHLLAAPLIAHPLFMLIGVVGGAEIGAGAVLLVLAVYLLFGLTALAIDRRALLVSALAYVLIALTALFRKFGVVELNVAVTALIIGSALLLLSAFWTLLRGRVVARLPSSWQNRLPHAT